MTCLDKTIKEASLFLNKLKKDYNPLYIVPSGYII